MKNCYNVFYSETLQYHGIARTNANEVCLSSVPKSEKPIALLYFNLEGYSTHCKKHKEYWDWVSRRNNERYKSNISHNKNYDAKNMMHTFRLLHMAKEIGLNQEVNVKRKDRDFLLSIKNAEFEYDELVERAETIRNELDSIYKSSPLKEKPDASFINTLALEIREAFYSNG